MIKYAVSRDLFDPKLEWTFHPWTYKNLVWYDRITDVPDYRILLTHHHAPWVSPLKEYIESGRPWIEIEYGYWGPDNPRRETRRVTYCGHHNLHMRDVSWSRSDLFPVPNHRPWRQRPGDYVLAIQPVEAILLDRTGENMDQFHQRLTKEIRKYWAGEIKWRHKPGGKKPGRWESFVEQATGAYAVVGERTMSCVESCLLGIPAYTIDTSMITLLMGPIENLAQPQYPDRTQWWEHVCWSQFNRAEFATSIPADLVEIYQILPSLRL
jgi:hypothetical protein